MLHSLSAFLRPAGIPPVIALSVSLAVPTGAGFKDSLMMLPIVVYVLIDVGVPTPNCLTEGFDGAGNLRKIFPYFITNDN